MSSPYLIRTYPTNTFRPYSSSGPAPGQLPVGNHGVLDNPALDEVWAGYYKGTAPNPYYDYYFSGQDIRIFIDGIVNDPHFGDLSIAFLAFNIEQKAIPLFGYNDYVYRTIAKGGRIVSGKVGFYSRSPDYVMQAVAAAAKARSDKTNALNDNYPIPLTEDDANIQQYWGNNLDPTNAGGTKPNLFSIHPPFSLVIMYGIQDVSIGSNASQSAQNLSALYKDLAGDQLLTLDLNDRLVPTMPNSNDMRLIIDDVQLVSMQTQVEPSGQALVEEYSFLARDIVYP